MTELTFDRKLRNYAELAIKMGVGLQPGQRLLVRAPVDSAPLVRLITEAAYKAGSPLVEVLWGDDALTLARFNYAPRDSFEAYPDWYVSALLEIAERGGAVLSVLATDPDLLKDQDSELVALTQKVHRTKTQPFMKKLMNDDLNWSIISQPIPGWAAKIFPGEPPAAQMSKLWDVIFAVCRADQPDPVAAWQAHIAHLAARRDKLNAKQYTALKYSAPGTDLTLGMPKHHLWHAGQKKTLGGIPFIPNIPTEEVFSAPHKDRVDGIVTSTKPLSYGGRLIDNFTLTFEQGRVVSVTAEKGEDTLKKLLEMDEGAVRLGEVALVPHSSPISQSGVLFFNTLFDENAASHLALGKAYRFCVKGGTDMDDDRFAAVGGNNSLTHVDFMIGSKEMDIDGVTGSGHTEPLMRGGEWVD